jgi:uncharacterized membrane protein YwaF
MRAAMFLVAALLLLAKLFSASDPAAFRWATITFVVAWLLVAAVNMWVGVTKPGYSVAEELPIFLLIFGVPALVAVVLKWRFL